MVKSASKLKVVYIGGAEHNGSTFLGTTLSNHPQVEFVGELSLLPREGWLADYICACGARIRECHYWQEVRQYWEKEVADKIDSLVQLEWQFDRHRCFPRVVIQSLFFEHKISLYSQYTYALLEAIRDVSGKRIIVDSSKRFSRALALASVENIDLRIIYLVRDSRGVAYSWSKPKRPKPRSIWDASLRWNVTNIAFSLIDRLLDEENFKIVRYEELVDNPKAVMDEIGNFVDLDLSAIADVLQQHGELSVGQHIGVGNGFLRNAETIKLRADNSWKQKMPQNKKNMVWALTRWGMKKHGYQR